MFSLDKLYPNNVESGNQELGYTIGAELFYGKAVKGGLGIHYTSQYGAFENLLLSENIHNHDLYGALNAIKLEALIKSMGRVSKDGWIVFDFGFGYFFSVKTSLDEKYEDSLYPAINDPFYCARWGLGVDLRGFNIMLDGEFLINLSEDTDKETFFKLGLSLGFAF